MRFLVRLYPARWRRRYGDEMHQLLADLAPMPWYRRLAAGVDLARGALDAHLTTERRMTPSTRAATRRAAAVALLVWAALSIEIVLSNVVFASPGDDDGLVVVAGYLVIFGSLAFVGADTARLTGNPRTAALTGAFAGGLIGALSIGTFFAVDNVFLDVVARQQNKIEGLARSGGTSMRAYINADLAGTLVGLTVLLTVLGAVLALAAATALRARRSLG